MEPVLARGGLARGVQVRELGGEVRGVGGLRGHFDECAEKEECVCAGGSGEFALYVRLGDEGR